jgi:hypothetical protein
VQTRQIDVAGTDVAATFADSLLGTLIRVQRSFGVRWTAS